jgi:hypothetical protein
MNSQLNVYAAEREVRPPAAPTATEDNNPREAPRKPSARDAAAAGRFLNGRMKATLKAPGFVADPQREQISRHDKTLGSYARLTKSQTGFGGRQRDREQDAAGQQLRVEYAL